VLLLRWGLLWLWLGGGVVGGGGKCFWVVDLGPGVFGYCVALANVFKKTDFTHVYCLCGAGGGEAAVGEPGSAVRALSGNPPAPSLANAVVWWL